MFRPTVSVTRRGSGAKGLAAAMEKIRKTEVYVGIPAGDATAQGPINNASLLFIHTHGSPLRHIPARPVLKPAIEKANEPIAAELAAGARALAASPPNPALALHHLRRAGMVASNAAKAYFTDPDNGWEANAPSTIRRKGSNRPLIDTGAMRRAITYVVKE